MAKLSINNEQASATNEIDRIVPLLGAVVKNLKVLTDSIDSVSKTVDRRITTNTDNAVKVSKAETESKKEENRHSEAMANIELEYKKICEDSVNDERRWLLIQEIVQMIRRDWDRLNGMDDTAFLSEEARASREELRKLVSELSIALIKAR